MKAYLLGFVLSILLTLAAYFLVAKHLVTGHVLIFILIACALLQAFVQLVFFLHLGKESHPKWNLLIFSFMVPIVVIVVLGSIWVMQNLNYHMM